MIYRLKINQCFIIVIYHLEYCLPILFLILKQYDFFCYDEDYDFISVIGKNCYYEKISNIELLQNYLTIDHIDLSLIHESQNYINEKINEITKQKIVIRVP